MLQLSNEIINNLLMNSQYLHNYVKKQLFSEQANHPIATKIVLVMYFSENLKNQDGSNMGCSSV